MSQASRKLIVAGAIRRGGGGISVDRSCAGPAARPLPGPGAARSWTNATPTNDLPNPYRTIDNFFQRPGRNWGSTSAVEIDKDGKTIWIAERCGSNSCADAPQDDTILHYDENGKLIDSFGAGLIVFPHGIHVDADGNIWVTDGNDNGAQMAAAAANPGAADVAGPPRAPRLLADARVPQRPRGRRGRPRSAADPARRCRTWRRARRRPWRGAGAGAVRRRRRWARRPRRRSRARARRRPAVADAARPVRIQRRRRVTRSSSSARTAKC